MAATLTTDARTARDEKAALVAAEVVAVTVFTAASATLTHLQEEQASVRPEGIRSVRDVERRRALLARARVIDAEVAQARVAHSESHLAVYAAQIAGAEKQQRDAAAALTQAEGEAADLLAGIEPAQQAMRDAERAMNIAIMESTPIVTESATLLEAKHAYALAQAQHEGAWQAVAAARSVLTQAENTLAALREGWLDTALRLEDQRHELLLLRPPATSGADSGGR